MTVTTNAGASSFGTFNQTTRAIANARANISEYLSITWLPL